MSSCIGLTINTLLLLLSIFMLFVLLLQTAFCEELFKEWKGSLDGHTAELKHKLMNDVKGLTTAKVITNATCTRTHMYV
jgi:hypothetical protein